MERYCFNCFYFQDNGEENPLCIKSGEEICGGDSCDEFLSEDDFLEYGVEK